MYFLNVYFTLHLLLSFKIATCKNRSGKSGNEMSGMRGMTVTRGLGVGRPGIRVGTRRIQVGMRGIRVGTRGQQLTELH